MILGLFIFFEIIVIGLFLTAFFTKQEILWAVTAVFSGILMITSYSIQYYVYQYNASIGAYAPVQVTFSYQGDFVITLLCPSSLHILFLILLLYLFLPFYFSPTLRQTHDLSNSPQFNLK